MMRTQRLFATIVSLALMICFGAESLLAQTADPTGITIPPAAFKIEPVPEQPKFSIASPILLGAGLVSTLVGTIFCLYSGSLKAKYDSAYAAWTANASPANEAAKNTASDNFFVPLLVGAGLNVLGIVLDIGGYNEGTGIKNLTPVPPVETTISPEPSPAP